MPLSYLIIAGVPIQSMYLNFTAFSHHIDSFCDPIFLVKPSRCSIAVTFPLSFITAGNYLTLEMLPNVVKLFLMFCFC